MITLEMPYPPSVNALYRSVNGRNVLSKTAREYYSNRGKAVLDMLMKAGVIEDDSQVDLLTISRQEVVKGGRCVVTIERIEEMAA